MGNKILIYDQGQRYEIDDELIYKPFEDKKKDEENYLFG